MNELIKNSIIEINDLHKEIQGAFLNALEKGIRIGELLIQEKDGLKHGNWMDWIEENLDFKWSQAKKYMQIYKNQKLLNSDSKRYLSLSSIDSALLEIRKIKKENRGDYDDSKEKELFDTLPLPEKTKLFHGDFNDIEIESGSVDHIITDPPYPIEFIECWEMLSRIAERILKPSGFLIAYCGHINLNKVIKILDENLIFYWICALIHKGNTKIVHPRNMMALFKPVLIYQKEPFKRHENIMEDVIEGSGREKDGHPWQQAEEEIKIFIEKFTRPNDLILDPFAGSGTIPVACFDLNRRVMAIDKEKENILKINRRIKKSEMVPRDSQFRP